MRLLYPCDPFEKKRPDETYEEEFSAAQAAGLVCSLYSAEDFELGEFKRKVFSYSGVVPEIVECIAARIDSPFFSVDVVLSSKGRPRLIELGDGQVSDRKNWPASRFVAILEDQ